MGEESQQAARTMHEGNWTCSQCGKEITTLPFKPDPERSHTLLCMDCHRAKRDARAAGGERKMYQGSWTCGSCGKPITELPFEPDPARAGSLKCRDCFRK